jgi:Cold shock proteins
MRQKNFRRDRGRKGFNEIDGFDDNPKFFPAFLDTSRRHVHDRSTGERPGTETEATVKWFNPEKGFGFVALADGAGDAFLHVKTLETSGLSTILPGTPLKVLILRGHKGAQVARLLEVGEAPPQPPRSRPAASRANAERKSGSVRWFNPDKGFGFIQVDDGGSDVFVHISVIRRSGLADLREGDRVNVDVVAGQKGLEAIRVFLA